MTFSVFLSPRFMTFSETTIPKALVIIHFNSIFNSHIHMGKILGIKKLYALVIRYALPARVLDGVCCPTIIQKRINIFDNNLDEI